MNSSSLPKEAVSSSRKVGIGAIEWKEIKPQILFPKKGFLDRLRLEMLRQTHDDRVNDNKASVRRPNSSAPPQHPQRIWESKASHS